MPEEFCPAPHNQGLTSICLTFCDTGGMKTQVPAAEPGTVSAAAPPKSDGPINVKHGDVTVKIYRTSTPIKGKTYRNLTLSYFASGKRQRRQFADLEKAKTVAADIARLPCRRASTGPGRGSPARRSG